MDIFEAIETRVSVRKYKPAPVEPEKLALVLNAGRRAPSWKNLQCARFLVLTSPEKKQAVFSALPESNPAKKALLQAPVIILVCADPAQSGACNGMDYYLADAAAAFEHLCLAARALGLGTCWVGVFDEAALKKEFSLPDGVRVVALTPLGYPEHDTAPRPRKELSEITFYEKWGGSAPDKA
ncbi:MAG: nitroreductase family protein [Elusimicrobiota bacterium]|nr:nitroreductase family protein [Elusimicrobiota bacterium]